MNLTQIQTDQKKNAPKKAVTAFKACPRCQSTELIKIDTEVLCGHCYWDSCKASVDAGHMDHLISEAMRQLDNRRREAVPKEEEHELPDELTA